ncbi:MAG: S-adenosylmethionine:tRNA ribosyltransferase-isomerase, partial [Sphingopyxis sp.]
MRVNLFDFTLPPERIALRPAEPRDSARMLCVGAAGRLIDSAVAQLPGHLRAGDCLVFNDTRVIPAQLAGTRGNASIGATLHKRIDLRRWQAFVRNAKRLRMGDVVDFGAGVSAQVESRADDGSLCLAFLGEEPVETLLDRAGTMPLPPYIAGKRPADDRDRADYQTMFAARDGAVAAPTASLHFTPDLLARATAAGILQERVTLHVGAGVSAQVE